MQVVLPVLGNTLKGSPQGRHSYCRSTALCFETLGEISTVWSTPIRLWIIWRQSIYACRLLPGQQAYVPQRANHTTQSISNTHGVPPWLLSWGSCRVASPWNFRVAIFSLPCQLLAMSLLAGIWMPWKAEFDSVGERLATLKSIEVLLLTPIGPMFYPIYVLH